MKMGVSASWMNWIGSADRGCVFKACKAAELFEAVVEDVSVLLMLCSPSLVRAEDRVWRSRSCLLVLPSLSRNEVKGMVGNLVRELCAKWLYHGCIVIVALHVGPSES